MTDKNATVSLEMTVEEAEIVAAAVGSYLDSFNRNYGRQHATDVEKTAIHQMRNQVETIWGRILSLYN